MLMISVKISDLSGSCPRTERFSIVFQHFDTGAESPMSKFLLHLFAAFAEMEREIIRERVCSTW